MNLPSNRREFLFRDALAIGLGGLVVARGAASAQEAEPDSAIALASRATARAVQFLRSRQEPDGQWSAQLNEPGITALVVTSLLKSGQVTVREPIVAKPLDYLTRFVKPEGVTEQTPHANYTGAIAIVAFQAAKERGDDRFDALIAGGQGFLKRMQWDQGEQIDAANPFYGGAGYGGKNNRPDLSNTSFLMEALRETGLPADDPALQKALVFVSRCQNLDSEFNDQPWSAKENDGGFIYTPANGGSSMAGATDAGGLRSYGGMTYAGLKSMIYAGLTRDDPRVQGALGYLKKHYTLEENPGLGQQGLYYYYHTFAKTMALLGDDTFLDQAGTAHDWRLDLVKALASRQNEDGSWVNPADRWMEGDPNLVTAYCLLALACTKKPRP